LVDGSLKACVDFFLTVIELLFLSLAVDELQGKTYQNSLLVRGAEGWVKWAKISGGRGDLLGIFFWFPEK